VWTPINSPNKREHPVSVDRVLIAAAVAAAAAVLGLLARRRRPDAPTQPVHHVPTQLDRHDFAEPRTPWLVAMFTSATCHTCAGVARHAHALAGDDVVVAEIEFSAQRATHERYAIDAVPTLLIADASGVVRRSFQGPVTADELWAAMADLRDDPTV
jgi:hypothetical protein